MKKRILALTALLMAALLIVPALAAGSISTTVSMRVSRLTQDAVVDAGEDLSIEIDVSGVEPVKYQWYFNDAAIEGADQRVYNLVNAAVKDAGIYRMDAFDANGKLVVSMDIAVRVVTKEVPKSGDASQPLAVALIGLTALCGLVVLLIRRRMAA